MLGLEKCRLTTRDRESRRRWRVAVELPTRRSSHGGEPVRATRGASERDARALVDPADRDRVRRVAPSRGAGTPRWRSLARAVVIALTAACSARDAPGDPADGGHDAAGLFDAGATTERDAGSPSPDGGRGCTPGPELCNNGVDDDCDGILDCRDVCEPASLCRCEPREREDQCGDGLDQDCDGQTDCADLDCISAPACEPMRIPTCGISEGADECGNGDDDDCDGRADCDDADCRAACGGCGVDPPATELRCDDGIDDDCDYTVDCRDFDCAVPGFEVMCTDAVDNDCDHRVDCDDPNCRGVGSCPLCTVAERGLDCANMLDDDCDGLVDLEDTDDCMVIDPPPPMAR